jgi:ABC-2 type transport system ATP-binding protein
MSPAVTVKDLRKRFSRRTGALTTHFDAVAGVSFDIEAGERVAIIGPNGAGKSTTLKMLTGVLAPSGGEASVLGFTPWRRRRRLAYRIGVVFGQRSQLWGELPARDSFLLLRDIYDQDRAVFARRLDDVVARFDLADLLAQPVGKLSLGQRMRCEIAASLLHGPDLLFLDEPTIGLDVTAKAALRDFVREQAEMAGQTVLLTSHDTRDIELVCSRVIVINEGRIVVDQPTEQLRRRFLGRKVLTVQSTAPKLTIELPGLVLRSEEPHRTVLEVDTGKVRVEQVIAAVLAQGGVEDITIEDPPMEEVIREIYASGG